MSDLLEKIIAELDRDVETCQICHCSVGIARKTDSRSVYSLIEITAERCSWLS